MDPTIAYRQVRDVTLADLRALDLIGYELIPVAEACSLGLMITALAMGPALLWHRGR